MRPDRQLRSDEECVTQTYSVLQGRNTDFKAAKKTQSLTQPERYLFIKNLGLTLRSGFGFLKAQVGLETSS